MLIWINGGIRSRQRPASAPPATDLCQCVPLQDRQSEDSQQEPPVTQLRSLFLVADAARPHSPAFERARALAVATRARVHAGAFCYSRSIAALALASKDALQEARDGYVAQALRCVEQQAVYLRHLGVDAGYSAVWAHPELAEILFEVGEQKSDLLVKDVAREPLLKRIAVSSIDEQLLRSCSVPVMLVVEDGRPTPKRILVAVDVLDSDDRNAQLMRNAVGLALQCDAELHLAYASEPVATLGSEALVSGAAVDLFSAEIRKSRVEAFRQFCGKEQVPEDRRHYLEGPAAASVCELARAGDFDLIVVANAKRSRTERWLMGSTVEAIMRHAPCSLLSVPVELSG